MKSRRNRRVIGLAFALSLVLAAAVTITPTSSARPGRPDRVILRGGGWGNNPYCLRVSYRHDNPPDIGLDMVGFRCAADAG